LPPLLVALTVVTGLVDAFSYLVLGHVFVANMTGNVVFLGFALAGARGFSLGASSVALVAFICGALVGGRIGQRFSSHRGWLLSTSTTVQAVLVGVAAILGAVSGQSVPTGVRYALIVVLAAAMGLQNAAVRRLAVPDLTTTVLTMTMTGIAADSTFAGGQDAKARRRHLLDVPRRTPRCRVRPACAPRRSAAHRLRHARGGERDGRDLGKVRARVGPCLARSSCCFMLRTESC
jgi:uncharacterized membrane protein YoaK (UPF0700 family)